MRLAIVAFFIFFVTTPAFSTTIYVPDDYGTIQEAINASVNGDTVIVRPGKYVENIDFIGKAITVTSEQGAVVTTIDGNQAGSVVAFQSGEGANSVLDGFTITNGVSSQYGGGIFCDSSSPSITRNIISENTSYATGGGICCNYSSPTITNNTIKENMAVSMGGGIICNRGDTVVMNNTISHNTADRGGGIYCYLTTSEITNNTISMNTADKGGGIFCFFPGPTVSSSILWANNATLGAEMWVGNSATLTISYSDVDGGQSSCYVETGSTLNWGAGMIDSDPLFYDPDGLDGNPYNDFRLKQDPCQQGVYNSCVDAGDPASQMIDGSTRTDGVQDFFPVDMGYHYESLSFSDIEGTWHMRSLQTQHNNGGDRFGYDYGIFSIQSDGYFSGMMWDDHGSGWNNTGHIEFLPNGYVLFIFDVGPVWEKTLNMENDVMIGNFQDSERYYIDIMVKKPTTLTIPELEGTWHLRSLHTQEDGGQDNFGYYKGTYTILNDGTFTCWMWDETGSWWSDSGYIDTLTSGFVMFYHYSGKDWEFVINKNKDVMAADHQESNEFCLYSMVKNPAVLDEPDIEGTWYLRSLQTQHNYSADDNFGYDNGVFFIQSNGNFSGTMWDQDGNTWGGNTGHADIWIDGTITFEFDGGVEWEFVINESNVAAGQKAREFAGVSLMGGIAQRSISRKATASRKGHFLTIMTRSTALKFFSHRKHRARLVLGLVAV